MDIRFSKKHGLNPTIPRCFFCGESKNEIALLGALKDDIEAPKNLILDYEPCDKCAEKFKEGVLIIAVESYPVVPNQPPIQKNAYPSGPYALTKPEMWYGEYKPGTKALMNASEFKQVFKHLFDNPTKKGSGK